MSDNSSNYKRIAQNSILTDTNNQTTNRINWVDNSKVIAIFLMVLCHAGLKGTPASIIYQFHMPAFFVISGYLYKQRPILKELRSFIFPIAFFSAINWVFGAAMECVSSYGSQPIFGG